MSATTVATFSLDFASELAGQLGATGLKTKLENAGYTTGAVQAALESDPQAAAAALFAGTIAVLALGPAIGEVAAAAAISTGIETILGSEVATAFANALVTIGVEQGTEGVYYGLRDVMSSFMNDAGGALTSNNVLPINNQPFCEVTPSQAPSGSSLLLLSPGLSNSIDQTFLNLPYTVPGIDPNSLTVSTNGISTLTVEQGTWSSIAFNDQTLSAQLLNSTSQSVGTLAFDPSTGASILTLPDNTTLNIPAGSLQVTNAPDGGVSISEIFGNGNVWTGHINSSGVLSSTATFANSAFPDGLTVTIPSYMTSLSSLFNQSITDPVVLDLSTGGTGVELTSLADSTAHFDLHGDGFAVHTGWVGPTTGILVDTANPTSITDLFGNSSTDGFTALKAIDSNNDGVINSSDSGFNNLKVWTDTNGNGVADTGEVQSLSSLGITSISLASTPLNETVNGNVIGEVATFTRSDNTTGQVAEAFFNNSTLDSQFTGSYTLNPEVLLLPNLRGYGTVPDLYVAMSLDPTLLGMVQDLAGGSVADVTSFDQQVTNILYRWAGVDTVAADSRGPYVNGQDLGALEAFVGESFLSVWGLHFVDGSTSPDPQNGHQGQTLEAAWNSLFTTMKESLLIQGPLAGLFPSLSYNYDTDSLSGTADFSAAAATIIAGVPTGTAAALQYLGDYVPFMNNLAKDLGVSASLYDGAFQTAFAQQGFSLSLAAIDNMYNVSKTSDGSAGPVFELGEFGSDLGGTFVTYENPTLGAVVNGVSGATNTLLIASGENDITQSVINNVQILETSSVVLTADELDSFSAVQAFNHNNQNQIDAAKGGTYSLAGKTTDNFTMSALSSDGTTLIGNDAANEQLNASSSGNDTLIAGNGSGDLLYAGGGHDTLIGGNGGDVFHVGSGTATMTGGTGNDTFVVTNNPSAGALAIDGGNGTNTLQANGDITGLSSISNVQTLQIVSTSQGQTVKLTADELNSFANISGGGEIDAATGGVYSVAGKSLGSLVMVALSSAGTTLISNDANVDSLIASDAGDDTLIAGDGVFDQLTASAGSTGNDTLIVGDGHNDTLSAQNNYGNNILTAGDGNNDTLTVRFSAGNDTLTAGNGDNDLLDASRSGGNDILTVGDGDNDVLDARGSSGNDTLTAGNGNNDTLYGGGGTDTLIAGSGIDTLVSGGGNTTFVLPYSPVAGTTITGSGNANTLQADHIDITKASISGVQTLQTNGLTLTANQFNGFGTIEGGGTIFAATAGIYSLASKSTGTFNMTAQSNGGTTLTGNDADGENLRASRTGNDTLTAGNGNNDTLYGGNGTDTLIGGSGNDTFVLSYSSADNDTIVGGGGNNILQASYIDISHDTISGVQVLQSNYVTLTADQFAGFTSITAPYGYSTLNAATAGIYSLAGKSTDSISMNAQSNGGTTLIGNDANYESLYASDSGNDTLQGGNGDNDTLNAGYGSGNDTLIAGNGNNDFLVANNGNDTLIAGNGNGDTLQAGSGVDTLTGGGGDDTFVVAGVAMAGTTIDGGSGANTLEAFGDISQASISNVQTLKTTDVTLTADQLNAFSSVETFYAFNLGSTIDAATAGTYSLAGKSTDAFDMYADSNGGTTLIGNDADGESLYASASGNDTLTAGNGSNDQLFAGGGNNTLNGGNGYDTYAFGSSFGQDVVNNAGGSTANGEIDFGSGISDQNLWFQQSGNDLQIDLLGTSDKITVSGWYSAAGKQVASVHTSDNLTLDSQISSLVSAMAAYAANNSGFNPATASSMPTDSTLQTAIAAAWHA